LDQWAGEEEILRMKLNVIGMQSYKGWMRKLTSKWKPINEKKFQSSLLIQFCFSFSFSFVLLFLWHEINHQDCPFEYLHVFQMRFVLLIFSMLPQ